MEKTMKDHLIDTFDDLGKDNQKKFKHKLLDRGGEPRVRRAAMETVSDSLDLADLMINTFTSREAPSVAVDILKAIGCNEDADKLMKVAGATFEAAPSDTVKVQPTTSRSPSNDEHFVDRHRMDLISRVNSVDSILDELYQRKIINMEQYCEIRAMKTRQAKMREIFIGPLESAGTAGKDALYEALVKFQRPLLDDLKSCRPK